MTDQTEKIEPWMQQKGEHSKSFFYFTVYRDLGPTRTIEKVIDEIRENQRKSEDESSTYPTPTMSSLVQLSASKGWVERCRVWDEHLDKVARTQQEKDIKEMVERHANESKELQAEILKVTKDERLEGEVPTKRAWVLNTTTHSYSKSALLERLSRGEPTEKLPDDLKNDDEIEDLFSYAEGGNEEDDD